jgi:hypothetical protein
VGGDRDQDKLNQLRQSTNIFLYTIGSASCNHIVCALLSHKKCVIMKFCRNYPKQENGKLRSTATKQVMHGAVGGGGGLGDGQYNQFNNQIINRAFPSTTKQTAVSAQ